MGDQRSEVARCSAASCALHAFRDCREMEKRTLVRAIRRFCLHCAGGNRTEIRTCEGKGLCPLWPFRLGASPETVARRRDRRRQPLLPGI
ncbi:MAG: hypothetical protein PWQ57_1694 [Desulfovibrionales bacterium]|nr:hypothetical protein [Desulfovibrionales bacterium]